MSDSFATPLKVVCQVPLSMGFPRQEYWSRLPFPPPGDLPVPGIEPTYPALTGRFFATEPPGKPSSAKQDSLFKDLDQINTDSAMVTYQGTGRG